ncbi:hypothetical protein EH223_16100 [candidate division KSB1 bacterium]|nr:permease [candidate division KSB1 bacterium]RQW01217.1 MAG: hypothetical protein EH223_16100 [candidate division KSB1 bacterium]
MIELLKNACFMMRDALAGTYTLRIFDNFLVLTWNIAPYFFIAILIQVLLRRFVQTKKMSFSVKSESLAIVTAALLGVLSPLPTYAAIPVALSFMQTGLTFSAVLAFAIASPLINPSVFFLTATQLGLTVALIRLFASITIAIAGGFLIKWIKIDTTTKDKIVPLEQNRPFLIDFYRTSLYLGKYFLVALFLSAAVKALISEEFISRLLGGQVGMSLLVAIALGVPFYTCGGAALPLIDVLMEKGMSTASAIAFFIAGPATKLETIYTYKSLLGTKILLFYLILTGLGAYLVGVLVLIFL